ncbi:MAG: squalene/phytoene synthase family protein [Rhodospirillales bacterium]
MSTQSSFYWPMRLLPQAKRQAMFALYGFCRAADDISDGADDIAVKQAKLTTLRAALTAWGQTGVALHPAIAALAPFIRRFDLPVSELELLLDGMETDVNTPLTAPTRQDLRLYCRQVAGTVGILATHIMGRPDAGAFALALAEALQLTNILRDVAEDARQGRLYLPQEDLDQAGIITQSPRAVLTHPALPRACMILYQAAQEKFTEAQTELARIGHRNLWPAVAMMAIYHALLLRLPRRDWTTPPPRLGHWHRLWIALWAAIRAA